MKTSHGSEVQYNFGLLLIVSLPSINHTELSKIWKKKNWKKLTNVNSTKNLPLTKKLTKIVSKWWSASLFKKIQAHVKRELFSLPCRPAILDAFLASRSGDSSKRTEYFKDRNSSLALCEVNSYNIVYFVILCTTSKKNSHATVWSPSLYKRDRVMSTIL